MKLQELMISIPNLFTEKDWTMRRFETLDTGDLFIAGQHDTLYMKTTNCCYDNTAVELTTGQVWEFNNKGEVRALK